MTSRRTPLRFVLAALYFWLATSPTIPTRAQSIQPSTDPPGDATRRWLVVPVFVGDADAMAARASAVAVRQEMVSSGLRLMEAELSREAFEARGSIPASELTSVDIERWVQHSQAAVRHLARADYRAARSDLLEAQQLSRRAAEALNREAARARQVLDTCLYMVRTMLETGDVSRAEDQARECRRLVPRVEPSAYRHTPEVRRLLARVDAAVAAEPPSRLLVESSPSGCAVRLNGIAFGETPFLMDDLAPGDYRLQVECDPAFRGRVRLLDLPPGETVVRVDSDFDRAIISQPELALRYADADAAADRLPGDARRLGGVAGAERVLLVSAGTGEVELLAVEVSTSLETAPLHHVSAEGAVDALSRAGWRDGAPEHGPQRPADADSRDERASRIGMWAAIGGGAGLATAWALYGRRYRVGAELAATPPQTSEGRQLADTFESLRAPTLTLGISGSLLASVALAWTHPGNSSPRGYSYALGGVGLSLAVASIAVGARRSPCLDPIFDPASCIEGELDADRAILLAASALPLITLPLTELLRARRLEVRARAGVDSFELELGGSF